MPSLKLSNPFRRGVARPSLKERAAALKASAGRVLKPRRSPSGSDPIFALIDAAREAERLASEPHVGDAAVFGSALAKEAEADTERRNDEEDAARLAAFSTRPRTVAGLHALVAFGCERHGRWNDGMTEDMPGTAELLATIRDSVGLLNGKEAAADLPAVSAPATQRTTAPALSALSVHELWHLAEAYREAFMWWGRVAETPWARSDSRENDSPAGYVAEAEYERQMDQWSAVHAEAQRRQPSTDTERDELLTLRLSHEMECQGRIYDRDLLADIAKAWGA